METVELNDLKFDDELNPRGHCDSMTVQAYADALVAGSRFPPISVDRATMRVVDGRQRALAFRKAGRKKINCDFVDVADDADFFMRAVEANSEHGARYSPLQIKNIRHKAERMGVEEKRVAVALRLPVEHLRAKPVRTAQFMGETFPLKNAAMNLEGKRLTEEQFETHKSLGGRRQCDYVNTVSRIVDTDLADWKNPVLVRQLVALCNLLVRRLSEMGFGNQLTKPFVGKAAPKMGDLESLREEIKTTVNAA